MTAVRAPLPLDSWMADYLAEHVTIVVCTACAWWTPATRPDPTRALRHAPTECPECRSHHGWRKPLVWATARITLDKDADG